LPAALGPQCHGAQPTAPGALAKAVFVAIACVEAIILSRLRKLVCTVSCCGALKGAQCHRADAELAATAFPPYHFVLCHSRAHFAVPPSAVLAKRSRAQRVLKTEGNSAPNSSLLNRPVVR